MVSVDSVFATYDVDCHNLYGLRKQQNAIRVLHDFMYHTLYHKRRFQGILCYTTDICNTRQKKKMVGNRLIINYLRERKTGLGPATSTLARLRSQAP